MVVREEHVRPPDQRTITTPASVATAGLALALTGVAFFVITTMRDDQLLQHGQRTSATAIRYEPTAEPWNFFDNGRLFVRYQTPSGTQVQGIWLDDSARALLPGQTLPVVYDPADDTRVRSIKDPNDPIPWGPPFLFAGLIGLFLLIWGGIRAVAASRGARWAAGQRPDGVPIVQGRQIPRVIPEVPSPSEPAWKDPRTPAQWRRYARNTAMLAVASVATAIAAGALITSSNNADQSLLRDGARAYGTVGDGNHGGRTSQPSVDVRYSANGTQYVGALHGPSPDDLSPGTRVTIFYDPKDPTRFRTLEYSNHSDLVDFGVLTLPSLLAFVLAIGTLGAADRLIRWRYVMQAEPWQTWHATLSRVPSGKTTVPLLSLTGRTTDGDTVHAVARLATGIRYPGFALPPNGKVMYLPGRGRRGIVTFSEAKRPYEVLLPRSPREFFIWHMYADDAPDAETRRAHR